MSPLAVCDDCPTMDKCIDDGCERAKKGATPLLPSAGGVAPNAATLFKQFIDLIESAAFAMPPVNPYTPILVSHCQAARSALGRTVTDDGELERLREFQRKIEEAEGRCCPEDYGFEEWIGVLSKRDGPMAHRHLQVLVSMLLGTMKPIGPMRDRKDYPPELKDTINYLHGRPSAPSSEAATFGDRMRAQGFAEAPSRVESYERSSVATTGDTRVEEIAGRHEGKELTPNEACAQYNDLLDVARLLERELAAAHAAYDELGDHLLAAEAEVKSLRPSAPLTGETPRTDRIVKSIQEGYLSTAVTEIGQLERELAEERALREEFHERNQRLAKINADLSASSATGGAAEEFYRQRAASLEAAIVKPGRWYFTYSSESEDDVKHVRSKTSLHCNLEVAGTIGAVMRAADRGTNDV